MNDTILNLSNEEYHNGNVYRDYLSSSQLKFLLNSPRYARWCIDNPDKLTKTEAQTFGTLFHSLMEWCANGKGVQQWRDNQLVFTPPINNNTNKQWSVNSQAYKEALTEFLNAHPDNNIYKESDVVMAVEMAESLLNHSGETSKQVQRLLKWGQPEVSHFIEYQEHGFKYRPDLETKKKIVDWKTVSANNLSEDSINSIISKYGYDISAAFYQFFEHERSGIWKDFYLIFISKTPPYDSVMVDMGLWAYSYDEAEDIVSSGIGAMRFNSLLEKYIECVNTNQWPGNESRIAPSQTGTRIMRPEPPAYENWKQIIFY